jgi:LuxR family maltose regulon positive regulatory protein
MPEYPVQIGKVHAPALREETLARDRLLEWLSIKIHRRVVLLVAEAGYGKTTLLADFTRRTRVRMLWYRLDRGDRDWVGFLAYLVAAVRVHVPDFGTATSNLLRETATSAPPLDTVLDTFLRELGGVPGEASALVFDDFHLVDDSPEVRHVIRELLNRGPDRMSFVFATRREPPIRLARLRAQGEVAELHTDDLRFDAVETEKLFRDTYDIPIEPAMLAELGRRTEGWAASLQLVRAALNDRDPSQVRAFISSLSGAEGHLYDYLAEEVIGDLPADLQQFLMRTSLLENVDLVLGPIAAGVSVDEARAFIEQAERQGLLGRGGQSGGSAARAHPLVRDFLGARLHRLIGQGGLNKVHLAIAQAADGNDWRVASHHYLAAGDERSARRVLAASIETVVATGAYAAADDVMAALPDGRLGGSAELILRSRLAQQRAAFAESLRYAEEALKSDPTSPIVLLNVVTARSLVGNIAGAIEASRLLESMEPPYAGLGRAYRVTMATSVDGPLDAAVRELDSLADQLRGRGELHFLGVACLNSALIRTAFGDPEGAAETAQEAIDCLSQTSAGGDLVSAHLARAGALSYLGHIDNARAEVTRALALAPPGQRIEVAIENGFMEAYLGDSERAWHLIERVDDSQLANADYREQLAYVRALLRIRMNDNARARLELGELRYSQPSTAMAFEARRNLLEGLVGAAEMGPNSLDHIRAGTTIAGRQGARLWALYGELLEALTNDDRDPSALVLRAAESLPAVVSMLAEQTLRRVGDLRPTARDALRREAALRPWRWRQGARLLLATGSAAGRREAATILAEIGEPEDIPRIRAASRALRDASTAVLALSLARRLAPRAFVEDLGRVRIEVSGRRIEGVDIRRKVLALLCLLLSKPRFASTREEVAEALWPDQDPGSALNSLNQTVYFLRRVFEPEYRDETSPIYVGQDGETIWLDQDLVDSRSRRCAELVRAMPGDPTPNGALELAHEYLGRFALDFAYEDWASDFRDALHAAYLRVVERAIQIDLDTGHFNRGTFLAERAGEVDPEADEIQAALVRLYRLSGAYAAAAEQYGRYSLTMNELGVEPRPFAEM